MGVESMLVLKDTQHVLRMWAITRKTATKLDETLTRSRCSEGTVMKMKQKAHLEKAD